MGDKKSKVVVLRDNEVSGFTKRSVMTDNSGGAYIMAKGDRLDVETEFKDSGVQFYALYLQGSDNRISETKKVTVNCG